MRSRRKVILAAVAVTLILVVAIVVAVRWQMRRSSWQRVVAVARELESLGFPTDPAVYDTYQRGIPAESNAALVYQEAFSTLEAMVEEGRRETEVAGRVDQRTPLDADVLSRIGDHLVARKSVLALLRKAGGLKQSAYPIRWSEVAPSTPLYFLDGLRRSADLLRLAAWHDAETGAGDDALAYLADALRLAQSVRNEPGMVPAACALLVYTQTIQAGLGRVLACSTPSAEALAKFQLELQKAAESLSAAQALKGQNALLLANAARLSRGALTAEEVGGRTDSAGSTQRVEVGRVMSEIPGVVRSTVELALAAESRTPEDLRAVLTFDNGRQGEASETGFSVGVSNLRKLVAITEGVRAELRSGMAAIAYERCRIDTERYPETLEELVPDYLERAPLDPFAHRNLTLMFTNDRLVIYSVGMNFTDDGGLSALHRNNPDAQRGTDGDDVGFVLWRR